MSDTPLVKPLGCKAYGSIPHLPGSRMGPGDHHCHDGQERICCEKARDRHDRIIVTEKLDGSCVSVARIDGVLHPLGRAGWPAISSPHVQHRFFAQWVFTHADRFMGVLNDGERVVGEWLAQAHGTRYDLSHEPFVIFDLMVGPKRLPHDEVRRRAGQAGFVLPHVLHDGCPKPIEAIIALLGARGTNASSQTLYGYHRALDPVEGAVWRVERRGEFDFLAKFVRPDKQDGIYLPEVSGNDAVWNWRPK